MLVQYGVDYDTSVAGEIQWFRVLLICLSTVFIVLVEIHHPCVNNSLLHLEALELLYPE